MNKPNFKIGLGEDDHAFVLEDSITEKAPQKLKKETAEKTPATTPLYLGNILIDEAPKVFSNSDGDVILHALCNAFDVAAGLGSIANYADEMCLKQGIKNSAAYVEHVLNQAREKGWQAQNVSISVKAKKPKLEKYALQIKKRLSEILKISIEDIGLTFTSGEGLSACGRGEGIRAMAILVLVKV